MKKLVPFLLFFVLFSCKERGLDTKFIASEYHESIVKILLFDAKSDKINIGSGYLGRGSGFFVTEDGYIFTNKHVVEMCTKGFIEYYYKEGNQQKFKTEVYSDEIYEDKNFQKAHATGFTVPVIQVYYGSGENDYKLYNAEVVALGAGNYDGAVLKITSDIDGKPVKKKFKSVPIGNSDLVTQGENLCVYGFPAQYAGSVGMMLNDLSTLSVGIMSGHDFVINSDYGYIKTDAEIHRGNSGGPVFNEENKVIGIATAFGRTTGIGLVSGINGMYYISAIDNRVHKQLLENGLTLPNRSTSINTISGKKQKILTAAQINNVLNARKKEKVFLGDYFKSSKIYFSNISPKTNNNKLPEKSKRYTSYTMQRANKGGTVWIYVDNYPKELLTNSINVYIEKYNPYSNKYYSYKNMNLPVDSSKDIHYFDYHFTEPGTYKFRVYSVEGKYINTNTLSINWK